MKLGKIPARPVVGARCLIRFVSTVLSVMVVLLAAPAAAQNDQPNRMSVRPHEMATATRTEQAGEFALDSLGFEDYLIYVPQQCVGARRCPLLVFMPWGGAPAKIVLKWLRPAADKHGIIVLAPTPAETWSDYDRESINEALKEVLQKFAIDPDKIALAGHCASGPVSMGWGGDNLDIFSRVISLSGSWSTVGIDPPNKTAEFYFEAGYDELIGYFKAARELRDAGHPVKLVVGLRDHAPQAEAFDFLAQWLQESWTKPDPAARTVPSVIIDSLPLLTTEMVSKMTAFWTHFQQEPESIRTTARWAHQREVVVPLYLRPTARIVDMPALAAQYPRVAAALKAAGLTAQQHEEYRVALLSVAVRHATFNHEVVLDRKEWAGPIEPNSVLAKNMAFFEAHPDEFDALKATKIWLTP